MSRYKQSPIPEFEDPVRAGEQFDEFDIEHDASGRAFDLWEPPSPDDQVFQRELRDALDRGLGSLDPRREVWIRLYYGIPFPAGGERSYVTPARSTFSRYAYRDNARAILRDRSRTLEEIAELSGCTRENVRAVINKGLRQLRYHKLNLRDVLHPELEEARRADRERQRLHDQQRCVRQSIEDRRKTATSQRVAYPKKRVAKRTDRTAAPAKISIDEALKKLHIVEDLWIRLHYGIPIDKKNKRHYPGQVDTRGYCIAPYKIDYPRSLEEISKLVKWPVDVVRRTIDDGLRTIRRRTGLELSIRE